MRMSCPARRRALLVEGQEQRQQRLAVGAAAGGTRILCCVTPALPRSTTRCTARRVPLDDCFTVTGVTPVVTCYPFDLVPSPFSLHLSC